MLQSVYFDLEDPSKVVLGDFYYASRFENVKLTIE